MASKMTSSPDRARHRRKMNPQSEGVVAVPVFTPMGRVPSVRCNFSHPCRARRQKSVFWLHRIAGAIAAAPTEHLNSPAFAAPCGK